MIKQKRFNFCLLWVVVKKWAEIRIFFVLFKPQRRAVKLMFASHLATPTTILRAEKKANATYNI